MTVREAGPDLVPLGLWIDGAIRESDGSERIPAVDPYTKASGFGRENGDEALHKSVWIELSGQTRDPFVMG